MLSGNWSVFSRCGSGSGQIMRIRIRPNNADPTGSGSTTLIVTMKKILLCLELHQTYFSLFYYFQVPNVNCYPFKPVVFTWLQTRKKRRLSVPDVTAGYHSWTQFNTSLPVISLETMKGKWKRKIHKVFITAPMEKYLFKEIKRGIFKAGMGSQSR